MTADITNPKGESIFKPCGEGDNICNCKSADECGYLAMELSEDQTRIIGGLKNVSCLPGSWDKRMIISLQYLTELTEKQNEWMYRLLYKYRKQLPHTYSVYQNHSLCCKLVNK